MKLIVPFIGDIRAEDRRLIELAEFLGIECEPLPLPNQAGEAPKFFESALPDKDNCLVLNPNVFQSWIADDLGLPQLTSSLRNQFRHLLVHAVREESFHSAFVAALTSGQFLGVRALKKSGMPYRIATDSRNICDAFAGLSFGQADVANDRVFNIKEESSAQKLILVDGDPLLAIAKQDDSEILLVGSEDVVDLGTITDGELPPELFSRLLPHAMVLRHVFGERSWHPAERQATVIIDDPLLRANYGFLNIDRLLGMMNQHNFHTTIAFIPYNFQRSSKQIAAIFRENCRRLSICFHGNDHTGAEFTVNDKVALNTMLHVAERRMEVHERRTGVHCERVMVFPQGKFSIDAMDVLKSRNFAAAINTKPSPWREETNLSIREIAQPAILRYGGLPLFHRRYSEQAREFEIAFDLFFGKPIFIVEHHDVFQNPQRLLDAVARVNTLAPEIQWSNVGAAVSRSVLQKCESTGDCRVRAYSRAAQVTNRAACARRFMIEWQDPSQDGSINKVLQNGLPCSESVIGQSGACVGVNLQPGSSEKFSLVYHPNRLPVVKPGMRHKARVFLRRRLSEFRDNYLSRSPALLEAAASLRRLKN
jgi:hypothetical protein